MTAPIAAVAERVPPQSLEAEQSTLGSMLLDKEAIAIAAELLVAEDFYRESHRVVFDTLIELFNRGEPADLVTVTEALKAKNALEQVEWRLLHQHAGELRAHFGKLRVLREDRQEQSILQVAGERRCPDSCPGV